MISRICPICNSRKEKIDLLKIENNLKDFKEMLSKKIARILPCDEDDYDKDYIEKSIRKIINEELKLKEY